jgi:multicomponent Na+:H+ antiporter subunit A
MLYLIVSGALAAAPLGLLARLPQRTLLAWLLALIPAGLAALTLANAAPVLAGTVLQERFSWVPQLGLDLSFALDGLSLLFVLIITGIGVLIVGYAGHYLADDPGLGRFLSYLFLFMGAMLGVVLSANVLTLFVFWELTSITSYLLIGYKHDYPEARRGAQQSLLITGAGGLALLVGLLLLGRIAGSYEIAAIIAAADQMAADPLLTPALVLLMLGAFTKSAQLPFHFWLPGAMQAPTPASAFLHSATMVKAGVYLLARFAPAFHDLALWQTTLTLVGAATMLFAAVSAVRQRDIKALLAYSTISMLGALTMQIGLGGKYGAEGVVVNILAHALYKSALFMLAGIIDHEAGTRDLYALGGLRRLMPRTMAISALALLSLGGVPVFFGFIGKELMLEAALQSPAGDLLRFTALAAIALSAVAYIVGGWRLFSRAFLGDSSIDTSVRPVHDPAPAMLLGPGLPAVLSLLTPLALLGPLNPLISAAAAAVYGKPLAVELKLWHGINTALLISLSALALGALLARREAVFAAVRGLPPALRGDRLFDRLIEGMLALAAAMTGRIQHGRLRGYLLVAILTMVTFVSVPLLILQPTLPPIAFDSGLQFYEILAVLLIPVSIYATIAARTRLGAIIAASIVGAMVSLFFVTFSAPDLALTQLLIEVLATVFLLLVFSVLPARFKTLSPRRVRLRDGAVALSVGTVMGLLVLLSAESTDFAPIAPFFLENSLALGKGANVVNVILVDFRGFDTLGEITVLFIAVLGIYGLLRLRQGRDDVHPEDPTDLPEGDAEPVRR